MTTPPAPDSSRDRGTASSDRGTASRVPGRLIGTEVEYGIACPDQPMLSSIITSTRAIKSYVDPGFSRAAGSSTDSASAVSGTAGSGSAAPGWDYQSESPLRDARGFDFGAARPASAIDPSEFGITNRVLSNGARFYVDHAHPEYSAPEVDSPLDAVVWDRAGDVIMHRAARAAAQPTDDGVDGLDLKIYKNNVDGKGASYGTHENYLLRREVEFEDVVGALAPHFITRQVFCGAGRVGIGQFGEEAGFQISQRADYIEVLVGLETTLRRGILNSRDEPHTDDSRWRRLHVIIGDANLAELATYLKIGTTALVLDAIESGVRFTGLMPVDPVEAVHTISHDPTLTATVALPDGREVTGVQLQREIYEICRDQETRYDWPRPDWVGRVYEEWGAILDALEADPMSCADRLDWPAKLRLLDGYRTRDGLDWSHPRLAAIDIQYSDIDPARGIYHKLVAKGAMRTLVSDEQVEAAITTPPEHTRAWLRGRAITTHGPRVVAANWDHVSFVDASGNDRAIDLTEPFAGTRADVEREPALLQGE